MSEREETATPEVVQLRLSNSLGNALYPVLAATDLLDEVIALFDTRAAQPHRS